jgi:hypothetical protein
VTPQDSILLSVWRQPALVKRLSNRQWRDLLWEAGHHKCLARTSYRLEDAAYLDHCPKTALDLFVSARPYPDFIQVRIAREIRKVNRLLRPLGMPAILLKGGAYLRLGLPFVRGRAMSDLDLMVHADQLGLVERTLTSEGYRQSKLNDYDQRYYRKWMHELPPIRHRERGIEVDIHHRVLPLTSRLNPEPRLMWQEAVEIADSPGIYTLSPPDMFLHAATHLFYDGEIRGGLKDLLDLDGLIAIHGTTDGYWSRLLERATQLELGRPLYYALRFTSQLLGSPIPDAVIAQARRELAPAPATDRLMRHLVPRVLAPPARTRGSTPIAGWLLYLRSHWLRMPPGLLARHLVRKAIMRSKGEA